MSIVTEMPCLHRRLIEIALRMSGNHNDGNSSAEEGRYPSFGVPLHRSPAVLAALCDIGKEKLASMQSGSTSSQAETAGFEPCKGYSNPVTHQTNTNTKIFPPRSTTTSRTPHDRSSSRFHPYRKTTNFVPISYKTEGKQDKRSPLPSNPSWPGMLEAEQYSDNIKKSFSAPGQLHLQTQNVGSSSIYDQMYAFSVRNLSKSCSKNKAPEITQRAQNLPTSSAVSQSPVQTPSTQKFSALPTTSLSQFQQSDNFRRLMLTSGDIKTSLTDYELQRQRHIATRLSTHGLCIMDDVVGPNISSKIRDEVIRLHKEKNCTKGALIGAKGGNSAIRSDVITWIDGSEPNCENIGLLSQTMDRLVAMGTGIAPEYNICGGTKLMIAKYPGKGTHYKLHVDNPAKDGRCITCTYFCNKDWNTKVHGGELKVHSSRGNTTHITPELDKVAIFYSDGRTPHEVLPCYKDRYAITLWYFDREERANALKRIDQRRNEQVLRKSSPASSLND